MVSALISHTGLEDFLHRKLFHPSHDHYHHSIVARVSCLLSTFKWCFCPWLLLLWLLILSCNSNGDNSPLTRSHLNTWSISKKLKSEAEGFSYCIPVTYLPLFPQPFFKVSPSFVSRESKHLVLTGSLCMAWWWSPFSGFHSSFYSCRYKIVISFSSPVMKIHWDWSEKHLFWVTSNCSQASHSSGSIRKTRPPAN